MRSEKAREILKQRFGYDSFRMNQEQAITALLEGRDCVVLMPTGGGKSLCYQIPALVLDGLAVVVSPLISLMKDQVDALRSAGINAAFLNSTQTSAEQVEVFRGIRSGETKLLYAAPERLLQSGDQFFEFLRSVNVSLFAIDEAHCISSWGHDFRPEYLRLASLKKNFPSIPVIALTATADKLVRSDIVKRLNIPGAELLISSFNRPNLFYAVEPKQGSYSQLISFLDVRRDQSGIVYCLSRNSVESLATYLRSEGFSALPYHAGLEKKERQDHQELFLRDEVKIIVATIAFGMGIDKSNVRFVVHMDLPKNIESYYQETGRAGRDGLQSDALLFFSWGDVSKLRRFVQVDGDREQSRIMNKKLDQMAEYGDLQGCRRRFLLEYFAETAPAKCDNCDNCTVERETFDGTIVAQKALSAVYRTGQRFGMNYLIDFLRGSQAKTIRDEHKRLKTFGVGTDISKEAWFDHFRELITLGYLAQAGGQYPILELTEKSAPVLKGEVRVELTKSKQQKERHSGLVADADRPYERDLFERLRSVRKETADRMGVPPYVVFADSTLVEMSTFLPQSENDLLKMSGVGEQKLARFGGEFLHAVREYCRAKDLTSRMSLKKSGAKRKTSGARPRISDTYLTSLNLFRSGLSVPEIAQQRGLGISTIEGHLARFIGTGQVDLHDLVPAEKVPLIREAIMKFKEQNALSPIKECLGDGFTYGEIRAVLESM